jgi:hypothetical protein
MGATQSKSEFIGPDIKAVNILDILATKYILTQNFKDMQKLGDKDYCNKLIVITSDVIKKFLKEKEITYIAQRIEEGVPVNSKKKASVIFLSTNKLEKQSEEKPKVYKRRVYNPDGSYRDVEQPGVYAPHSRTKEKTLLTELDVKNRREKESMCRGIAKFYIKIAHLFAAILKAVNPIYKYNGHEMSILNKSKIPKGTKFKLAEVNLCNRRIKTMNAESSEKGKIKVRVSNCGLNRKVSVKQLHENILDDIDIDYGEEVVKDKTLGQEIGIPELDKLYYDIYDYASGKFNEMSKKSSTDYNNDLEIFYKTFTGKKDYRQWNSSKKKKFSDIPLIAYHDTEQCKDPNSAWQQSYTGSSDNPLFVKFADNIKNMIINTKKNQGLLLGILDKLFVWVESPDSKGTLLENKMVTINPDITSESLQSLVEKTRKLIIDIYLQCEREYQEGLKLFEAIVGERMLKNSIMKKRALEEQMERVIVGDSSVDVSKIIQENVIKELEPRHVRKQSGGTRKKR